MPISFTVASIITIAPALALMFFLLGKYEGKFDEKQTFLTFIFGIIVCSFSMLLAWLISAGSITTLILLIPVICTVAEMLLLNRRKLSGTSNSVFYGTAFGLGFGAVVGAYFSIFYLDMLSKFYPDMLLWIFAAMTLLLTHTSSGILISFGAFQKRRKYMLLSLGLKIIFYISVTGGFLPREYSYMLIYITGASLLVAGAALWYLLIHLYPKEIASSSATRKS